MHAKVFLAASLVLAGCVDRTEPSASSATRTSAGLSRYGEYESLAVYHFQECARLSLAIVIAGAIEESSNEALVHSYLASELESAALRIGMSEFEARRAVKEAVDLAVGDFATFYIQEANGLDPDMEPIIAQSLISCYAIDVDLEPVVSALQ